MWKMDDQQDGKRKSANWLHGFLQGIVGAILSATILAIVTMCGVLKQVRTQYQQNKELSTIQYQQSYDLNVAGMVVEVLVAKDTSLYPLLRELLDRVENKDMKAALTKRVKENPDIPDTIKQQIIEIKSSAEIGISDSLTINIIRNPNNMKRGVKIYFVFEDTISLRRVEKIQSLLLDKGMIPQVLGLRKDWFYEDRWAPESDVAEIRYNNSNAEFATKVKAILDSVPELGKFKLNKTNIGTPPYGVLIILPSRIK
ncbi:hypothetical protein ES703_13097 [subsurface metagenome]|nr:hypothetical protein [bacterium]